jgi:hypothetical protein
VITDIAQSDGSTVVIEVERTGPLQVTTASDRFRVSYPFPIALSAIFWVLMWFCLAGVITQGGFRPRHVNVMTSLVAWVLYLFAAFVGPGAVLSFSGSLEVEGTRLLWKRWFACRRSNSTERKFVRRGSSDPKDHMP